MYTMSVTNLNEVISGASKYSKMTNAVMKNAMEQSLTAVTNVAKQNAPYRTGKLRRSIFNKMRDVLNGQVSTATEYAAYVEYGTNPHTIVPRRAKVLAFKIGGSMVFAKKVQHPGFSGRFYMRRTAQTTVELVKSIYEKAFNRLVNVVFKQ